MEKLKKNILEKIEQMNNKSKIKYVKAGMTFSEIIENFPEAIGVLLEKGMHCVGCPMSQMETLGQGAEAHGMDVKELIKEINKVIKENN